MAKMKVIVDDRSARAEIDKLVDVRESFVDFMDIVVLFYCWLEREYSHNTAEYFRMTTATIMQNESFWNALMDFAKQKAKGAKNDTTTT